METLSIHRPQLSHNPEVGRIRFRQDQRSAFYRTLRERVNRYFDSTGRTRFATRAVLLKGVFYLGLTALAYGLILSGAFGPMGLFALANLYGVASLMLSIAVAHDAAHDSLTPYRPLNYAVLIGCFMLLGADPYLWRLRHVRSHHAFPNVNGCDIDIDSPLFLRLSPNHRRRWFHRYQHLYAVVIFWLVDIHTVFIQDIHYLFKRRLANLIDIRHPRSAYALFVLCKLAYIAIVFVIPATVLSLPWWQVLIGSLSMSFVSSALFVYLLIGTHFSEETVFPEVGPDGRIDHDWALHAMITSLDWSPYSRLGHFILGGANAHAAHHLFPNVSHAHYIPITRIIATTSAEFGIPHNVTTLPRMIRSHFRFLRRMGRTDGGRTTLDWLCKAQRA